MQFFVHRENIPKIHPCNHKEQNKTQYQDCDNSAAYSIQHICCPLKKDQSVFVVATLLDMGLKISHLVKPTMSQLEGSTDPRLEFTAHFLTDHPER
jgi:hypothetical protein